MSAQPSTDLPAERSAELGVDLAKREGLADRTKLLAYLTAAEQLTLHAKTLSPGRQVREA